MNEKLVSYKETNKLRLVDTVVLNGRVENIEYEDRLHRADYIGVRTYAYVPTFAGEMEKEVSAFAFTPEIEEKLGWGTRLANVRMAFSESPIDPHVVAEAAIMSYYGMVEKEFFVHYSEMTGYLWTDEEFKVGDHSLIDILNSHIGEYVHMEMELFSER